MPWVKNSQSFSAASGLRGKVANLQARVRYIAADEGFALNPKKTRDQRPESRQSVTGHVVNVAPAVPRYAVRWLRAILHRVKAEGLEAQNREGRPNFRGWVEGMIASVAMVKPEFGKQFQQSNSNRFVAIEAIDGKLHRNSVAIRSRSNGVIPRSTAKIVRAISTSGTITPRARHGDRRGL